MRHQTHSELPVQADRRIMELIVDQVATWSKHPGRKLGAVITGPNGEFRALGFNGLPRGMDDQDPRYRVNPLKSEFTICAERNALRNAAAAGTDISQGCSMHVCWCPCEKCAVAIAEAGIARVYAVASGLEQAHPRWGMSRSNDLLREAGVQMVWHDADDPRYRTLMDRLPDTPAVPSHSTDWDKRFLQLSKHVAGWRRDGTGEILVRRAFAPHGENDKIVRALGCHAAGSKGALENARQIGTDSGGKTLYLSALPDPPGLSARLAGSRLAAIAVPSELLTARNGTAWKSAISDTLEHEQIRLFPVPTRDVLKQLPSALSRSVVSYKHAEPRR